MSESGDFSTSNVVCIDVTWKIPHRLVQISIKMNHAVESPTFSLAESSWRLALPQNYFQNFPHRRIILLYQLDPPFFNRSFIARMCFKTDREDVYMCAHPERMQNDDIFRFHLKNPLVEGWKFLIPIETVTVFCQLGIKKDPCEALLELPLRPDGNFDSSRGNRNKAGSSGATQSGSCHSGLLNTCTQTDEPHPNVSGIHNLQSDYKKLLENEEDSDVWLKVSDKEFRAHKCILRARSSVFSAMFKHDTEEKNSGKVVIEDMDPESFPDFLQHMYAGSVDSLTEENVFSLYIAADKYDMSDLKAECRGYMEKTLSVDTFCDVMVVALRYKEDELLKVAVNFFSKNLARIIVTVKWQKFLKEHDTAANELLIKTFVPPNKE